MVRAMPNARQALEILTPSIPCHLATNAQDSDPEQIRAALSRVGMDKLLSEIFCVKTIGQPKPSPEFFAEVSRRLGCDSERLAMVGDDLEKDVLGAKRCGIRAVWYNPNGQQFCPEGIDMITDLMQLPSLFSSSGHVAARHADR